MVGATRQACSPSGDTENDLRPDGISMIIGRKPTLAVARKGPSRAPARVDRLPHGIPHRLDQVLVLSCGNAVCRRANMPDALKVLEANLTNGQTALAAPARKQTPGRRNRHLGRPHAVIVPGRRVKRMPAG